MKCYYLTIICCILFISVLSQNNSVDTLFKKLHIHPQEDSIRSELLTDVAYFFRESNNLLTIKYLDEAKRIGAKYNTTGFVGGRNLDLGETYTTMGNSQKAMECFLEAEKIFIKNNNTKQIVKTYSDLTLLYLKLNNVTKAKEYISKACKYIDEKKPNFQLCIVYSTMGDAFMQEGLYDSSIFYLNKIIDIAPKIPDSEYFKDAAESNIGLIYKKQKKYNQAIDIFNRTLSDQQVMNDPYNEAIVRNNLGSTYSEMKKYSKAQINFDSSISICKAIGIEFLLIENYKNLAGLYERSGDKALELKYLKQYHALNDSINSRDNQNQLNQLERNYFEDAKEKLLTTQKEKSKRSSLIAFFTGLLALSILYFYYRSRKKSALLNTQKLEIEKQNVELEKLNHTKDKLFRVIGHDLRNPLVSLSAYLDKTSQPDNKQESNLTLKNETTKALQDSIGLLDNLLTWASSQLHNEEVTKRNIILDDLIDDVCISLKSQAQLKQIQFNIDIKEDANNIISNAEMLAIIFRNILTNAIKFSHPGQTIYISSRLNNHSLLCQIRDEGVGMNAIELKNLLEGKMDISMGTSHEKGSGLGISIVKDLADKLKVNWEIDSEENKGSTFTLYFDI